MSGRHDRIGNECDSVDHRGQYVQIKRDRLSGHGCGRKLDLAARAGIVDSRYLCARKHYFPSDVAFDYIAFVAVIFAYGNARGQIVDGQILRERIIRIVVVYGYRAVDHGKARSISGHGMEVPAYFHTGHVDRNVYPGIVGKHRRQPYPAAHCQIVPGNISQRVVTSESVHAVCRVGIRPISVGVRRISAVYRGGFDVPHFRQRRAYSSVESSGNVIAAASSQPERRQLRRNVVSVGIRRFVRRSIRLQREVHDYRVQRVAPRYRVARVGILLVAEFDGVTVIGVPESDRERYRIIVRIVALPDINIDVLSSVSHLLGVESRHYVTFGRDRRVGYDDIGFRKVRKRQHDIVEQRHKEVVRRVSFNERTALIVNAYHSDVVCARGRIADDIYPAVGHVYGYRIIGIVYGEGYARSRNRRVRRSDIHFVNALRFDFDVESQFGSDAVSYIRQRDDRVVPRRRVAGRPGSVFLPCHGITSHGIVAESYLYAVGYDESVIGIDVIAVLRYLEYAVFAVSPDGVFHHNAVAVRRGGREVFGSQLVAVCRKAHRIHIGGTQLDQQFNFHGLVARAYHGGNSQITRGAVCLSYDAVERDSVGI